MDNNASTWQSLNINAFPIPVNTQFILLQVFYANASMINSNGVNRPGYVDDAVLTLTAPEPSSMVLGGIGLVGMLAMGTLRRRRAA